MANNYSKESCPQKPNLDYIYCQVSPITYFGQAKIGYSTPKWQWRTTEELQRNLCLSQDNLYYILGNWYKKIWWKCIVGRKEGFWVSWKLWISSVGLFSVRVMPGSPRVRRTLFRFLPKLLLPSSSCILSTRLSKCSYCLSCLARREWWADCSAAVLQSLFKLFTPAFFFCSSFIVFFQRAASQRLANPLPSSLAALRHHVSARLSWKSWHKICVF